MLGQVISVYLILGQVKTGFVMLGQVTPC